MFLSREGRDLGVAFQDPPGCQASSRGEAKDSAVLPSRDADLLEPPSGVNGVKPPLHFGERARDCSPGHAGKEGPSPREDGGVSGVSSSCGACGGFLLRHGEDHGASRAAPGKSGLPARSEEERVVALE